LLPSRGDIIIFNAITANDSQRKPAPKKCVKEKNEKLLFHFEWSEWRRKIIAVLSKSLLEN
jgi:hypothetical protein